MTRVIGPIGGSKTGFTNRVRKQFGRQERQLNVALRFPISVSKKTLPDGTRIKTINIAGIQLQRSSSILSGTPRMQPPPFRITRIRDAIDGVLGENEPPFLYMETGVNDPINVGATNPLRLEPANWQIPQNWTSLTPPPNSGIYQGLYRDSETIYLADNESLAVGEGTTPSASLGNAVYLKKLMMGFFPPSVFSGLMRLFMQSHYGADNELTTQFRIEVSGGGTEILLYVGDIQIGFWAHLSAGIIKVGTDADLDYRLITIKQDGAAGNYIIYEYPIVLPTGDAANVAIDDYVNGGLGAEDKEKVLAYLFAHSTIGQAATEVDTFTLDNAGSDLAYGWKFNNVGTKASICLNELYIDGSSKWHFDSSEITLAFGYSTEIDGTHELGIDSVSETTKVRWHDVPNVQIWRPNTDETTCSRAYRTLPLQKPAAYDYTDAPIYCWYDAEDVLQVIKVSHTVETYAEKTVYDYSGNVYPTVSPPITNFSQLIAGAVIQDESRWIQQMVTTSGTTDQVVVNAITYDMVSTYGTLTRIDAPGAGACGASFSSPSIYDRFCTNDIPFAAPDYQEYLDAISSCGGTVQRYLRAGPDSYTTSTGLYWLWSLVDVYVPILDAEAAYVATLDYFIPEGSAGGVLGTPQGNAIVGQDVVITVSGSICWQGECLRVWQAPKPCWVGNDQTEVVAAQGHQGEVAIFAHSRTLHGEEGAYDGSVDQYFFRGVFAEDPPSKTFRESWGVAALRGSDLGTLDDEYADLDGTWTGWI